MSQLMKTYVLGVCYTKTIVKYESECYTEPRSQPDDVILWYLSHQMFVVFK